MRLTWGGTEVTFSFLPGKQVRFKVPAPVIRHSAPEPQASDASADAPPYQSIEEWQQQVEDLDDDDITPDDSQSVVGARNNATSLVVPQNTAGGVFGPSVAPQNATSGAPQLASGHTFGNTSFDFDSVADSPQQQPDDGLIAANGPSEPLVDPHDGSTIISLPTVCLPHSQHDNHSPSSVAPQDGEQSGNRDDASTIISIGRLATVPLPDADGIVMSGGTDDAAVVTPPDQVGQLCAATSTMTQAQRNSALSQMAWLKEYLTLRHQNATEDRKISEMEMSLLHTKEQQRGEKKRLMEAQFEADKWEGVCRLRAEKERLQQANELEQWRLQQVNHLDQQKLAAAKEQAKLRHALDMLQSEQQLLRKYPNAQRALLDIEGGGLRDQAALRRLIEHYPSLIDKRSRLTQDMLTELRCLMDMLTARDIISAGVCPVISGNVTQVRSSVQRALRDLSSSEEPPAKRR